jgi:hypothetical protein
MFKKDQYPVIEKTEKKKVLFEVGLLLLDIT